MDGFTWEEKMGLKFITISMWKNQGVSAGFSSRSGGVSAPPYNNLNLALHVGDDDKRVLANRKRFLNLFAREVENMVCCEQMHGNSVAVVGLEEMGRGSLKHEEALAGFDAMVTATPGIMLNTFYADCVPVYFFDPVMRIVAIAHCGWKSTMGRIADGTVRAMQERFGTSAYNIEAFIGPGIGKCCFYIDDDLARKVKAEFTPESGILERDSEGYRWDLKLTNRLILQGAGVRPENIIDCNLCTACNREDFFSYRREQGKTGRMAAVIALDY